MMEDFMTVNEMARMLRIGRSSAYELCREKGFPILKCGKSIRIPKKPLLEWIDKKLSA